MHPAQRLVRRRHRLLGVLSGAVVLTLAAACGADDPATGATGDSPASDYPRESLEWVVPFGPTSGSDALARHIVALLEGVYPENITVRNMEGGSGSAAYSYLKGKAGDPYVISISASNLYTTPLASQTNWKVSDFTPVALVGSADYLLMVPGDAPYNTFQEFAAAAKADRLTVGTVNVASTSFLVQATLADQAGYEQDPVPFGNNGELQTALLSKSIDSLVASPDDVLAHIQSGKMKALGFTGPERLKILPDVPTFKELGFTVTVTTPYGIILPPDVDAAARQWWIDTMKALVEKPEYVAYMAEHNLSPNYKFGDEFGTTMQDLSTQFEQRMREVGAVK